ncbi:uncharacterized LabA/DUF88 family protein [Kineosphaera limosa]|uniref:Uncharacterized protein n=1 Tax=Kineosphaera limosa NBRC 100340 TaxID=1184609 RepID=K6WN55_9MICO|nr:NYN domain-containing protein [Kineosphaera limosa]NYE01502.1 uncharacterized LabA/DUF88 family protein [Kineosphaera limosa]GAB95246.1 hypothetical protein KILIM_017_00920 [Kineosphaera limosa NBRC 100340]
MRIGVFVDGYNVYYGAQLVCGQHSRGWKWLDLSALVTPRVAAFPGGITQIHYCTARRGRTGRPQSVDQDTYLAALTDHDPRIRIHLGKYVKRIKQGVLLGATRTPVPWPGPDVPDWLTARRVAGAEGEDETLVSVRVFEEKGSDVSVAVALVEASVGGRIDAAVVLSNDSDLALALRVARSHVPVGLLNPGPRPTAADLQGDPADGVGGHWWGRLSAQEYLSAQMPDVVGPWHRPADW